MKNIVNNLEAALLKVAENKGFKEGVKYLMEGKEYTVRGNLFIRKVFKFGEGTDAVDYFVINHDGKGFVYNSKTKTWGQILTKTTKKDIMSSSMIGKYVRLEDGVKVFLVMDKVTVAVASGTNAYVENQKFILMNEFGQLFDAYYDSLCSVLALENISSETLSNFQKFKYRH